MYCFGHDSLKLLVWFDLVWSNLFDEKNKLQFWVNLIDLHILQLVLEMDRVIPLQDKIPCVFNVISLCSQLIPCVSSNIYSTTTTERYATSNPLYYNHNNLIPFPNSPTKNLL